MGFNHRDPNVPTGRPTQIIGPHPRKTPTLGPGQSLRNSASPAFPTLQRVIQRAPVNALAGLTRAINNLTRR